MYILSYLKESSRLLGFWNYGNSCTLTHPSTVTCCWHSIIRSVTKLGLEQQT